MKTEAIGEKMHKAASLGGWHRMGLALLVVRGGASGAHASPETPLERAFRAR